MASTSLRRELAFMTYLVRFAPLIIRRAVPDVSPRLTRLSSGALMR